MKNINTKKGFTIIEVVLVLAIAGLIFLMVFVALPSLQDGQKDNQRKSNYALVSTAIESYKSNHSGAMPKSWGNIAGYLDDGVIDPEGSDKYNTLTTEFTEMGESTSIIFEKNSTSEGVTKLTANQPIIVTGAKCDKENEGKVLPANGGRNYAIVGFLSQGIYCEDY